MELINQNEGGSMYRGVPLTGFSKNPLLSSTSLICKDDCDHELSNYELLAASQACLAATTSIP
jgi:hypothetical protein